MIKCARLGQSGPLCVFLHGYGGGPLEFHNLSALLEGDHRLLIPNLIPLFSSAKPISYSRQVEAVAQLISEQNTNREPFFLLGSSYGGTLSWALRTHFHGQISGHILVNPMPLNPLNHIQSPPLRLLFGMNMVPGALPLFLRSGPGQRLLIELGDIFGLSVIGSKSHRISSRKLDLIAKAVQRFAWIVQNESWEVWQRPQREILIPTLLIGSDQDPLFTEKDFRTFQLRSAMTEYLSVNCAGHMAVRSESEFLFRHIKKFISDLHESDDDSGTGDSLKRVV